jgi:Cys-tRNA(Pro)/Cys-tRNA(Cys) deacylase
MGKEVKTNAMRILDKNKIKYEMITYECDTFIDGIHTAEITGVPVEQSYKTLVMRGKSGQFYVFVVPVASEVDLKAAARAVSEKSVEMIHVKDITAITGYVRGGCSPLGLKKQFPTVIDASAEAFAQIYVSGGRIGATIRLGTKDLASVTRATFAAVIQNGNCPE